MVEVALRKWLPSAVAKLFAIGLVDPWSYKLRTAYCYASNRTAYSSAEGVLKKLAARLGGQCTRNDVLMPIAKDTQRRAISSMLHNAVGSLFSCVGRESERENRRGSRGELRINSIFAY